jgi:cytochrome c oxidase subunit I
LIFLAVGGALAKMIRWQWAYPGTRVPVFGMFLHRSGGIITPATYQSIFTMHGLIMIFFAITPILIGCFGNFTIPLMIGAQDMAFPKLNMLSFWTFVLSLILITASFFVLDNDWYARIGSNAGGCRHLCHRCGDDHGRD